MAKGKRVRISNESVNCYGTRILTPGIDLAQYQRNPVLLYMHERGKVVGMVKDLKVEGQDVTGELVFDEATELSKQLKKQWEFGSVKMVSANFQILEMSDEKVAEFWDMWRGAHSDTEIEDFFKYEEEVDESWL